MTDPNRPGWFKRLSSSTATGLRSLSFPPPDSSSFSPERTQDNMKESSPTDRFIRFGSLRQSRQQRRSTVPTTTDGASSPSSPQPSSPVPPSNSHTSASSSSSSHQYQHRHQQTRPAPPSRSISLRAPGRQLGPPPLGPMSSPGFPDSLFYASEFMLGVGMVILQPATARVVIVHETNADYWFLPKGRKDVGESLQQAALREAYEESGYRAEFLPLYVLTNAPSPPGARSAYIQRSTEPIFLSTHQWRRPRWPQNEQCVGGEYLTFWFVGQIPADAVREEDTGMPDEKHYVSHLVDIKTAVERLHGYEKTVVLRAFNLWTLDAQHDAELREAKRVHSRRIELAALQTASIPQVGQAGEEHVALDE